MRVPSCDVLTVGFSCRDLSLLRDPRHGSSRRIIRDVAGPSGTTWQYAIKYISKCKPRIILLENVPGLLAGFIQKDELLSTSSASRPDEFSNLNMILQALKSNGYCTAVAVLSPSPRLAASRKRAWIVCVLVAGLDMSLEEVVQRGKETENLMKRLSSISSTPEIGIDEMIESIPADERQHWLREANAECSFAAVGDDESAKWRGRHREAFRKAGLDYPPVFSDRLQAVINTSGMRVREAEVLHYHERLWPIESTTCREVFLDLSMSLGRASSCKNDRFPIIVPKGRIFKRCAMEWLTVPEAMACQGYCAGMAPALRSYTHRQVSCLCSIQYILFRMQ